ncbi:glycosyltransferase [Ktedonospora formicarum]|uniref:Glycosyltransferase 2-like domain-containing protein n=1 Tax=Ktedonospora formicarum TaxID=2778364 RepID=A0A8J3I6S9_9CHLR|nr:glycosyltransferase family A protein [Ktedonospora formicarum]GHO46908.1 hypothetical protein KSX_50710 [Ktedonospora formicarum]
MLAQAPEKDAHSNRAPDLVPMRIIEIELGQPLPVLSNFDEKKGRHYQRALGVVRLHTQPLGTIELQLPRERVEPSEYAQILWNALHNEINEHLQQDGLTPVSELRSDGLPRATPPPCIRERNNFLGSTDAPFVSVIVPTHDRPERLAICLNTLLAQHYPHYEVIVVDNAPKTESTLTLITKKYSDASQVRYLREERQGASWARNCGMQVAKGEILVFTDDDVVLDTYWLTELVRAFRRSDNVACVTGLILPLELEEPAQFWFEQYGGFTKGFRRRIFDMAKHHPKTRLHPYTSGQFGTGASMAFSAAYLRDVGGFDPALGGTGPIKNGQDIAAFFEVMMQGYQLVYEPLSLAYHLHRRDYAGLLKQIYGYGMGLTAHLTKCICDRPRLFFDLLSKLSYGLFFALSGRSAKNQKRQASYPKELKSVELKGMLQGPVGYLRSRSITRKAQQKG